MFSSKPVSAVRLIYALPHPFDPAELRERLGRRGRVLLEAPRRASRDYLDTFDWRVFRAGGVIEILSTDAAALMRWRMLDTGFVWHERSVTEVPRGTRDLPPGRMRRRLARVIDVRALTRVAHERGRLVRGRVLDGEDKTVLGFESFRPEGSAAGPARLELLPVRGFDAALTRAREVLGGDVGLAPLARDPILSLTESATRRPGEVTTRSRVRLDADSRTDAAVKFLLRRLCDAIRENEAGIVDDVDTEFLHDQRVAIRRTRALLSQIPRVLPESRIARFRREFAWLGGETGSLRDLDVYLLDFDGYRRMLPGRIADDLLPLREHLSAERAVAHARLVAVLRGARYRRLLADWSRFLDAAVPGRTRLVDATKPVGMVASARIWRTFRRSLREGRAIDEDSPAESLHDLRKTCKKLRYLLELLGGLFDDRAVAALVKRLKRLQDVLGEFQDVQVQSDAMRRFEAEMQLGGRLTPRAAHAIERLVAVLDARGVTVRATFAERFAGYDSKIVRKRFRRYVRDVGIATPRGVAGSVRRGTS